MGLWASEGHPMNDDPNVPRLGHLVEHHYLRDAIHIAVIPATAGQLLRPGNHIGMDSGKAYLAAEQLCVGVVDPFLRKPVELGERFWLLLYPGTIRSLRHEWTHSAFPTPIPKHPTPDDKAAAESWLRALCSQWQITYDHLVEDATEGHYITFGTDIHSHSEMPEREEMWNALEVVTGREFDRAHREGTMFSCSC